MALTVRTGEAWGAGAYDRLRPIVVSAGLMAIGYTIVSAQCFIFFNEAIAGWFLTDPVALKLTTTLLLVAAAFQFSDALQIVFAGALRGLDDVRVPAWLAFFAYWIISLPLGWWMSYGLKWSVAGMWWGDHCWPDVDGSGSGSSGLGEDFGATCSVAGFGSLAVESALPKNMRCCQGNSSYSRTSL